MQMQRITVSIDFTMLVFKKYSAILVFLIQILKKSPYIIAENIKLNKAKKYS